MERNIYDRQISKQVETDGVKSLVGDEDEEDQPPKDFDRSVIKNMSDPIPGCVMDRWGKNLTQEPSQHDTLQLGGQESKLSKADKENAERRYQQEISSGSSTSQLSQPQPVPPFSTMWLQLYQDFANRNRTLEWPAHHELDSLETIIPSGTICLVKVTPHGRYSSSTAQTNFQATTADICRLGRKSNKRLYTTKETSGEQYFCCY